MGAFGSNHSDNEEEDVKKSCSFDDDVRKDGYESSTGLRMAIDASGFSDSNYEASGVGGGFIDFMGVGSA